jgi:predicted XRE-type DNA-binding protein
LRRWKHGKPDRTEAAGRDNRSAASLWITARQTLPGCFVIDEHIGIGILPSMNPIFEKLQSQNNIALNLRRLMSARFLTQDELATAAGVSQPLISKLLHGKISPSAVDLANIANALNVSSQYLMRPPARQNPKKVQSAD